MYCITKIDNGSNERPEFYNNLVNAGLHVISPKLLEKQIDKEKIDLDRDILKPLQGTGKLFAYDSPEYVKDMGTPERYESVCRDIRTNLDAGKPVVPVSLNFSRLDFELMDAVQELEDLVAKYSIPKELIHVEVTESALTDDFIKLNEAMNRIKEMGYALWLDDFGSGYSSLNVLKDYQFDVVKIDMRFLSNLDNSEKAKTLIDCIIQMANRIDMLTLTEGVETETQAEFLNRVGCNRLQGYLFGKPMPKEELDRRIEENELKVSDKKL